MSEIFVAGDIHGNYQGLMESLNAAGCEEVEQSVQSLVS